MRAIIRAGCGLIFVGMLGSPAGWAAGSPLEPRLSASLGPAIGATVESPRPLLPRTGLSAGLEVAWEGRDWIPFALGLSFFQTGPSWPDPSLFLYRGFGGLALCAESGARFRLADRIGHIPAAKGLEAELLGGLGLAAIGDTGTTLVSLSPFLRVEPRLSLPLWRTLSLRLGLPLEVHWRGGALTGLAGLSLGISLDAPKAGSK